MKIVDKIDATLAPKIEAACNLIAPLWPLKNFVAVNPYFGQGDQPFWQAGQTLEKVAGAGLTMPRDYYLEQIKNGRITREDLSEALRELGSPWNLDSFDREMARKERSEPVRLALLSDVLGSVERQDWSNFVVERISQFCAAYFDDGQAMWPLPWKGSSFYAGWREYAALDRSSWMMGLRGMASHVAALPDSPERAIAWSLEVLGVPQAAVGSYLHAALLSIGGWAGWARYRRWQAELRKEQDDTIRDLLAVRVAWDALLFKARQNPFLTRKWQEALEEAALPVPSADPAHDVDAVLQTALELGYRKRLVGALTSVVPSGNTEERSPAQAVFCIDVRSEIFRRALETVAPKVRTHGFAGFFGVLVEVLPFGSATAKGHLPILFNPSYRVREVPAGVSESEGKRMAEERHHRIRTAHAWKAFKTSAASCFSFVESFGVLSIGKLIGDSMGWTRPVPHPDRKGLKEAEAERLVPTLSAVRKGTVREEEVPGSGIPEADRPAVAEFALRNMGLTGNYSRLVLLVGHGSTTANNPQATGLDCGACAGQTGEASARIAATLLNDPVTRRGLAKKGIVIPEDTFFVAGLHDTTTDEVSLYDTGSLPPSHDADLRQLEEWLEAAGEMTRMERAAFLGIAGLPAGEIESDVRRRTRDWAEVRPEWALAGNAAFIAAPRSRTAGVNLGGRAFLHDYNWRNDAGFATLKLIMTAPMVVGNWINMQYYGSMVDNLHFGSGNKVLHNVVGGSIGVLEGNGGDLRVGLAMQSLHDGRRWIHEPIRLNVVIEAPQEAIDEVIGGHALVRNLIENEWIFFFRIDDDGSLFRRASGGSWLKMNGASV